jgi:GDP-4-dehydro-6-deoxy-D-mannose reductase
MRALITGGDGFVGQHLLRELGESSAEVVASVQRLPPRPSVLERVEVAAFTWKQADVRDADTLYRLIGSERPDVIFHLAGFASGALARERPADALAVNAGGTLNLFTALVAVREESPEYSPTILVMGSGDAYGPGVGEAFTEETPLRPTSPYGLSKACQELVAHSFRRSHGLDTVVARSFNLIGAGQAATFAVPDFCRQAAEIAVCGAEPVLDVGNLDAERDFTDVRDAVCALRAIVNLKSKRPSYNVCSGRSIAIGRLLEWVLDEAGVDPEIRVVEERLRQGEDPRVVGDPGLIKRDTGWEARGDIEAGVREVYRWTEAVARRETGARTERS